MLLPATLTWAALPAAPDTLQFTVLVVALYQKLPFVYMPVMPAPAAVELKGMYACEPVALPVRLMPPAGRSLRQLALMLPAGNDTLLPAPTVRFADTRLPYTYRFVVDT